MGSTCPWKGGGERSNEQVLVSCLFLRCLLSSSLRVDFAQYPRDIAIRSIVSALHMVDKVESVKPRRVKFTISLRRLGIKIDKAPTLK